ncbi:MAG: histidine phosphatase family protein [Robiginitomaculum sp.]|nr:histidine phosphatase family protein [Robiginitomaculum sp.]
MSKQATNPLMKMLIGKTIMFLGLVAAMYFLAQTFMSASKPKNAVNTVYVVRHAEKLTGPDVGRDPKLSETGSVRANVLAELLRDKNISHIHSSNYIRTRNTGAPLAKIMGLEIEIYDPSNLDALADKIKQQSIAGGVHHLVVGHSNTSAETVIALGGVASEKSIYEKLEYDRLYKVEMLKVEKSKYAVRTKLSRYGFRYKEEAEN